MRIADIRGGMPDSVRRFADGECQSADLRGDEGEKNFSVGKYVAATNCWHTAVKLYADARAVAERREKDDQAAKAARAAREAEQRARAAREAEQRTRAAREAEQRTQAAREAEQRTQEQERSRKHEALLAQLARGSQFFPNPPLREAGKVASIVLPDGSRMTFAWCPPGRFLMGSPLSELKRDSGENQHLVTLTKGFWIGRYEVTRNQWKSVMGGSRFMISSLFGADGEYPVDEVSWRQCMEFCRRLSQKTGHEVRLPTEAEWEYACRAGTATPFSFGSVLNGDRACCAGGEPYGTTTPGSNSYTGAARVGSYSANPWGIFDMHGNVYEWCADYFGDYPEGEVTDPRGPDTGQSRVRRGGCWNYYPNQCRSAFRSRWNPGDKAQFTGFRVCCEGLE